jgi:hypothetical protein
VLSVVRTHYHLTATSTVLFTALHLLSTFLLRNSTVATTMPKESATTKQIRETNLAAAGRCSMYGVWCGMGRKETRVRRRRGVGS